MKVLLLSPVRGLDPNSGDVTYTEQLLAAPPPGVSYTTYDTALREGTLEEIGTRTWVDAADGVARVARAAAGAARKAETLARRSGVLFRERIRAFRVDPSAFDLIHVHVFHTRFVGRRPPVVMSAAGPLSWVYGDAWGWRPARLRAAEVADAALGAITSATMCATRLGSAEGFVSFSDYLAQSMTARGLPSDRITVVPNYLADACSARRNRQAGAPRSLGFVAKDFDAKGGPAVLEAFQGLRARRPDLVLTIVGSPPRGRPDVLARQGIRWLPFVERDELLRHVVPELDLFLYPSRFDGMPYGPMEALSAGVPLVVSDYRALPELVRGGAGVVAHRGDAEAVRDAADRLLDPAVWGSASSAASRLFSERYSAVSQAPRLGAAYARFAARRASSG